MDNHEATFYSLQLRLVRGLPGDPAGQKVELIVCLPTNGSVNLCVLSLSHQLLLRNALAAALFDTLSSVFV